MVTKKSNNTTSTLLTPIKVGLALVLFELVMFGFVIYSGIPSLPSLWLLVLITLVIPLILIVVIAIKKTQKLSDRFMFVLKTIGVWVIASIAVIAIIDLIGILTGSDLGMFGSSCVTFAGYRCQNPTIGTNGNLSFQFGQNMNTTIYKVELGCTASDINTSNESYLLDSLTFVTNSLVSSENTNINVSIPCYGANGERLENLTSNPGFSGYIWINYTDRTNIQLNPNLWAVARVEIIR